jgi:glutamyl-tRNA reductase
MNDEARFTALYAIVASKLAEIKATQEIILKSTAEFLAVAAQADGKEIFADLRKQAAELAETYREQVLTELQHLQDSSREQS